MLISVIIPCYNVQDYIEECVASAFAQNYPNLEVICIDNNSTDGTWEKLEQLQQQYPSLIIDKELKPGAPAARNKGLWLSKGEWLQFLDADDLLRPNKIQHQIKRLNGNESIAFIAGACIKRDLAGNEITQIPANSSPFKSLFVTQLGITSANMWNRKYIEKIKGWDESLKSSQEADLMFRLLQINQQVLIDKTPLTIVRERPFGQISQTNPTDKWVRYFNKRFEMVQWLKHNRPAEYAADKNYYEDALFGLLKIISNNNRQGLKVANQLYHQHFKGKYRPSEAQMHSTKPYLLLFRLMGFKAAELFRRYLGK